MRTKIITTILALLVAGAVHAQGKTDDASTRKDEPQVPTCKESEVSLTRIVPKHASATELFNAAHRICSRKFHVLQSGGFKRGPVSNLLLLGDAIVIYDTPENTRRIKEQIASLDVKQKGGVEFETITYTPRHASTEDFRRALQAVGGPSRGKRGTVRVDRLDTGVLIVHAPRSKVAEIRQIITSIDKPAPRFSMTCWIVRGSREAPKSQPEIAMPAGLEPHLSKLLAFPHFTPLGMGLVQASLKGNDAISMDIETLGSARTSMVSLRPSNYDESTSTLSLSECRCNLQVGKATQTLVTRLDVKNGEYTVIGALGSSPVFVVLRLTMR